MNSQTASPVQAGDELAEARKARGVQTSPAATGRDRGIGPFPRLVLRGATMIDGTGAPPWGPVDIVIEKGRIVDMVKVGTPHRPIDPAARPSAGVHEIDCHGRFVTPGFIDSHAHIGSSIASEGPPPADYIYKLWLAHGVTTVREMGCLNGLTWTLDQRERAAAGTIAAPRIVAHAYFPAVNDMLKIIHTPQQAREWLQQLKARGADGVKFFGAPPAIMQAALAACGELELRSGCHHAQMAVTRMNALTTAGWGLTSAEHYYGLPEALFEQRVVQDYPAGYNYGDEYFRFSVAGQTFMQAAPPGSPKWRDTLERFLALGFTFVPTFNIYDANRDLMRTRRADWHDEYTWKSYWDYFQPHRGGHGSYWYRWSTRNEIEWKRNYGLWMHFINDYKNLGGRVCAGSDSGFIFQVFGFGFVRELEMLQEAGFHPLEAVRAATLEGAHLLGIAEDCGSIEIGKRADLLVHDENPLDDFKLLYGTGAMRLNDDTNSAEWRRSLRHTIANGIVYDCAELLADVRSMVAQSHSRAPASGQSGTSAR